jgi:hypothetical protein
MVFGFFNGIFVLRCDDLEGCYEANSVDLVFCNSSFMVCVDKKRIVVEYLCCYYQVDFDDMVYVGWFVDRINIYLICMFGS